MVDAASSGPHSGPDREGRFFRALGALVLLSTGALFGSTTEAGSTTEYSRPEGSARVMVFAPHPDDEALGCAGIMRRALAGGDEVRVVFTTCGDANAGSLSLYESNHPELATDRDGDGDLDMLDLGIIRHDEGVAAMAMLGLGESDLVFLGYPNGGIDNFWNSAADYTSPQTGASSVPTSYGFAYNVGAPHNRASFLADVKAVIEEFDPTFVYTTTTTDTHQDHWATTRFVARALEELGSASSWEAHFSYLIHWEANEPGFPHSTLEWTDPVGHAPPDLEVFLADFGYTPSEKLAVIDAHVSQVDQSPGYLRGFAKTSEIFWLEGLGPGAGLGAFWPFDGGKALDRRNWNDGVLLGDTGLTSGPIFPAGGSGDALAFDGDGDCVSVRPSPTLDITRSATVAALVRIDGSTGADQVVLAKGEAAAGALGYMLVFGEDAGGYVLRFEYGEGFGTLAAEWSGRTFSAADGWVHLAVVADAAGQQVDFYLDGALDATGALAGTSLPTSTVGLSIGARPSGTGHAAFFRGALDEVYVLPDALDAVAVRALYQDATGTGSSPSGGCSPRRAASATSYRDVADRGALLLVLSFLLAKALRRGAGTTPWSRLRRGGARAAFSRS